MNVVRNMVTKLEECHGDQGATAAGLSVAPWLQSQESVTWVVWCWGTFRQFTFFVDINT